MFGDVKGVDRRTLEGILADLYQDPQAMRELARRAGLPSKHVRLQDSPSTNAHNVVTAAGFSGFGGIPRLVRSMAEEFPEHPWLSAWALGVNIPSSPMDPDKGELVAVDDTRQVYLFEWLHSGIEAGQGVVRLELGERGLGTGFVGDGVWLITTAHYLSTKTQAKEARLEFFYEYMSKAHYRQRLAPGEGFYTSQDLNLTVCCLTGGAQPAPDYPLDRITWPVRVGQPCQVIGHPGGLHKTIIPYSSCVTSTHDDFFDYTTYGTPASEGSPVFDDAWNLLGITVSGGWLRDPYPLYSNRAVNADCVNTLLHRMDHDLWTSQTST